MTTPDQNTQGWEERIYDEFKAEFAITGVDEPRVLIEHLIDCVRPEMEAALASQAKGLREKMATELTAMFMEYRKKNCLYPEPCLIGGAMIKACSRCRDLYQYHGQVLVELSAFDDECRKS